jgi:DNA-binding IclR family transcriptional regulator
MADDSVRIRPVPAVTRALAIMRLVSRSPTPLTVRTIATKLGLVPSTVLHIVRALAAESMLELDPNTKKYRLGVGVLPFARALLEHSDFPNLVRPALEEISRRHNVLVVATEAPDLVSMIVVAMGSAPTAVKLHVDVGSRLPALAAAPGRCLAAFGPYSAREVENQFRRLKRDLPPYEDWIKQVETTRMQGFYVDDEYIKGLTIVGMPVPHSRATFSALSAVGISPQLDENQSKALVDDMLAAAHHISDRFLTS